jgi:hypothetical protein
MKGNVINIDKQQIELINLIDEWLRDEMMEASTTYSEVEVISDARIFLTKILEKGWYREGGDDQLLLMNLRKQWIDSGGKWRS